MAFYPSTNTKHDSLLWYCLVQCSPAFLLTRSYYMYASRHHQVCFNSGCQYTVRPSLPRHAEPPLLSYCHAVTVLP